MNKATLNTKKIIILLVVDAILYLIFKHYQPLCEPCITGECPLCLSTQQYNIIYLGIIINIIYIPYVIVKSTKKWKL
jgi:hypothetical protein